MAHEQGVDVAVQVENFINGAGRKACEGFVEHIVTRTHRTLQQCLMRQIIVPLILKWAAQTNYDQRNEATIRLCQELKPTVEAHPLPFI